MNEMSSLERVIYDILNSSGIYFVREKIFEDCRKGNYRYDFYLPDDNILLEVDGSQHFIFNKKFFKNRSDFLKSKERDRLKNSYALAQGIKLYRIPYWEIDNIKSLDDIFRNDFLVRSKFHNDEAYRIHQNLR